MPTPFQLPTYTAQVMPGADPVTSLRPPAIVQGSSTNPHAFAQADAMQALKQAFAPRPYMPWFAQQAPAADWSRTYNTSAWMPPWVMNPGTVSTGGTNLGLGGMFGYTGNYGASPGPGVDNGTWGGVPRNDPISPQQPNWITSAPPASTGPRIIRDYPVIDGQPGTDPWKDTTPVDKVVVIDGKKPGAGGTNTGGTGGTGTGGTGTGGTGAGGNLPYGSVNYPGFQPEFSVTAPTPPTAQTIPDEFLGVQVPLDPGFSYAFFDKGDPNSPNYNPSYEAPPIVTNPGSTPTQALDLVNRFGPLNTSITPVPGEGFLQFAQRAGFPVGYYGTMATMGAPSDSSQWMSHLSRFY